jgi:glycosyltransferase involved in cell wall biosynthesis
VARKSWRLPKGCVTYIPNGIDCSRFAERSDSIPLPTTPGPVIGTVAALRPEKNIERLLRAVKSVSEKIPCRLVVAGDGTRRDALERLAHTILRTNTFVFAGHIDAVEKIYSSLDIFALSSDTEQMPTSVMEAMAAGLPVVSTDVGDVSIMVSRENARFVVARDDRSFAEALGALLVDRNVRIAIGAANRAEANAKFRITAMFSAYDALFRDQIARGLN